MIKTNIKMITYSYTDDENDDHDDDDNNWRWTWSDDLDFAGNHLNYSSSLWISLS